MAENIVVNLDKLTLGGLEKLSSDSFAEMIQVFDDVVILEGVPEEGQYEALRALHWKKLSDIADAIRKAVDEATNPKENGKN